MKYRYRHRRQAQRVDRRRVSRARAQVLVLERRHVLAAPQ
jgi:hypothetical protein